MGKLIPLIPSSDRPNLTADELKAKFARDIKPWDEQWGGKCPYRDTKEGDTIAHDKGDIAGKE